MLDNVLDKIYESILGGDAPGASEGVQEALDLGGDPSVILNQGMIEAMGEVGDLYEAQEIFVPEMLISARAMKAGLSILRPKLVEGGVDPIGKVILGTVQGDLHDIGKNLVGMMMEGKGFEVIDLGIDVPHAKFVEAVREHQPAILGMSALLTTTMTSMKTVIEALQEAGLRQQVKVMVGGAPITDAFAESIGADRFSPDAASAANNALALLSM